MKRLSVLTLSLLAAGVALANPPTPPPPKDPFDAAIPNEALRTPFAERVPIEFVASSGGQAAWAKLPAFWNEATEEVPDPVTGKPTTRKVVRVKVPLGLSMAPAVPAENPMALDKWVLGKRLYYDKILSSNHTISCATCHEPNKGFSDQLKTSNGINAAVGGMNAPTVLNSAYNKVQFWDGRAMSLEEQALGPVGNSSEMFAGEGDPWEAAVARLRKSPEYVAAFVRVFGHAPTKDAAAKAIATYERTVFSGNSLHDRAEVAARVRALSDEFETPGLSAKDYAKVLTEAAKANDAHALEALKVDAKQATEKADELGKRLFNGRTLYFNKARCSTCHIGDNFTDNLFHNLGVGVKENKLAEADYGRYAFLPVGHKDVSQVGAFKTPTVRGLTRTAPYMHDGSEKTLEEVVEFYDKGGNANEFLAPKMRDAEAEAAYCKALAAGEKPALPKGATLTRAGAPVIPLPLKLTAGEKADLILFLRALEGAAIDPIVADPAKFPGDAAVTGR